MKPLVVVGSGMGCISVEILKEISYSPSIENRHKNKGKHKKRKNWQSPYPS